MIAIIGGGRIGINLNRHLNALNIKNTVVSRYGGHDSISWREFLEDLVQYKMIVNCATLTISNLKELIEALTSDHYLVHLSSVSVYGNEKWSIPYPVNEYGCKKLEEEGILTRSNSNNLLIIRLANVFGGEPETSPVLGLINNGELHTQNFSVNGINVYRDFIHITHLINFIALCFYNPTYGIYNFSNSLAITVKDLIESKSDLTINSLRAADNIDDLLFSSGNPGKIMF